MYLLRQEFAFMRLCVSGDQDEIVMGVRLMFNQKVLSWTKRGLAVPTLMLAVSLSQAREPELEAFSVTTHDGTVIEYNVEIARTAAQMRRGLMFRDSMPENQGMLFIYQPDRVATMWMKNTILSLDMLFIDSKGLIVNIAENTTPFSLARISSGEPVRAVVELNAGQVEKHGIQIGDRVNHTAFDQE